MLLVILALSRIRPGAKKARTSATVTSLVISIFLAVFDNHICIKLLFMRLLKTRRAVMRTRRRSSISTDVASIGLGSLGQFLSMYAMDVKI